MSEKHAIYKQLKDTLQEPGCPICHIGEAAGRKYLDILLFESVNDPGIRKQLESSLGFCYYHSRELLTFPGKRLGAGIIEQHMLKVALRQMQKSSAPSRRSFFSKRDGNQKVEKATCPACEQAEAAEGRAARDMLQHFVNDLDQSIAEAGGLCLNHVQLALSACDDKETHTALIRLHEPLWQEEIALLDEFIRKHDHRFRHEGISQTEGNAVVRSIEIITGERPL